MVRAVWVARVSCVCLTFFENAYFLGGKNTKKPCKAELFCIEIIDNELRLSLGVLRVPFDIVNIVSIAL